MEFLSHHQWIIILLPFLIIVVIGIVSGVKNVWREKSIQQKTQKLGFFIGTQANIKDIKNIPTFCLLKSQSNYERFLQIRNIINGCINGTQFIMFDYISTFSKSRSNIKTILALPLPDEDLPDFRLVPLNQLFSIQKRVIEQTLKRQAEIYDTLDKQIKFASKLDRLLQN